MNSTRVQQTTRRHLHALLAIAALSFGGFAAATVAVSNDGNRQVQLPALADLQETSNAFSAVAKLAAPAVVHIKVEKQHRANVRAKPFEKLPKGFDEDLLKRFFGDQWSHFRQPEGKTPQAPPFSLGQGSGFVISADGYILTNAHVVDGATKVTVRFADGREMEAKTVGTDKRSDVAVVKIDANDLPMLRMGNSDELEVGQWVLAVGSPFGLPGTVTSGIVSAKGRSSVGINDYENFIQTDAAINPGNSGGPLLNLNGEAIGINTAIFSRSGASNGIGLAIPINMARNIGEQLINSGSVTRGWLGVSIQPLTAELAESFGLPDNVGGALIGDVVNGSPALQAGLKSGDVIVEIDGQPVENVGALRNRVASKAPESTVHLTVLRDGERQSIDVTIGTLPGNEALAAGAQPTSKALGLTVAPWNDKLAEKYGYADDSGVIITDVDSGSVAQLAGIQPGSLITEVHRKPVPNMDDFQTAMKKAETKGSVMLRVKHGELSHYVVLKFQG